MANIIKIRSSGRKVTPYLGTAQTDGKVQKAFAEKIGGPVGDCVRSRVHKGMGIGEIHNAVKDCAKEHGRVSLGI